MLCIQYKLYEPLFVLSPKKMNDTLTNLPGSTTLHCCYQVSNVSDYHWIVSIAITDDKGEILESFMQNFNSMDNHRICDLILQSCRKICMLCPCKYQNLVIGKVGTISGEEILGSSFYIVRNVINTYFKHGKEQ
jgi:hypothetical protein